MSARLTNVDLNMLVPLNALLEERSVSKAADRLHLSQPSLSTYLARLRKLFDDELLERRGNNYELTPLAVQLLERTRTASLSMERLFLARSDFDPSTTEREFTVVTSDYAMIVLGGALTRLFTHHAPRARLRFYTMSAAIVSGAPDTLRDYDGLLMPHGFLLGQPFLDLFQDRWVCAVAPQNGRVGDTITMRELTELPWIYTYTGRPENLPGAKQMHHLGLEPKIDVICPNFSSIPALLAGTDRVALLQHSLAAPLARAGQVRMLECPFEAHMTEAFWWHPVWERDSGHRWLRRLLTQAVEASHLRAAAVPGADGSPGTPSPLSAQ